MNSARMRVRLRTCPWLVYLVTALTALLLKAHYSRAAVDDLAWVLQPTARIVGAVLHQPLLHDAHLGWRAADGSFVIAPVCAGVNFLIVVLIVTVFGFVDRLRTPYQRWGWFVMAAGAAYLSTIAVNALRIVIAVGLYRHDVSAGWLTPERVHRCAGTAIYVAALCAAWMGFDRVSACLRRAPVSSDWIATLVLPAAYVGLTVVVPLLNGAWQQFGGHYLEHAMTVSLIAASGVPLLSLMRWATSGAIVSRAARSPDRSATRNEGDGQAHRTGSRGRTGNCRRH